MESWWSLGEWSGHHGNELAMFRITCPFCLEQGNFSVEHHAEKKQPNGRKVLNFDTLKCANCTSYVQVFWSSSDNMHDFRVQPWPLRYDKAPEQYPTAIGRFWLQAKRNLKDRNWDAATVMARSALQLALRSNGATGQNLKQEIDSLAEKGVLPPVMQAWSHNVRELGNDSAHPNPEQDEANPKNASDIVGFLDFLLEYLYTLPKRIDDYRQRKDA